MVNFLKAIIYKIHFNHSLVMNRFFLDTLKEIPHHNKVLSLLADISSNWEEIGLALDVSKNDLKGLKQDRSSNTIKLSEVIDLWAQSQTSTFSWETLISAIEGPIINNKKKAEEIRNYLYGQQ